MSRKTCRHIHYMSGSAAHDKLISFQWNRPIGLSLEATGCSSVWWRIFSQQPLIRHNLLERHLPPGRPHLEDHRQHEYKKNEMKRKSREHVEKACPFDGTSKTRKSKAARPKLKNSIAWEGVQVLLLLFWKLFTSLNRCVKCISPHFIYSDCLIYIYLSSCSWYITWCGMRYVSAAIAAI